jgi:uncharacterized protein involved in exopolysaccharide biosynthesis
MTFIGKILVIVVMVFSLMFLGISTVSLSTAKNWAGAIQKEQTAVKEFQKKLTDAKAQADLIKKALDDSQAQLEQEKKSLATRIAGLQEEIKRDEAQTKTVREQLTAAHQKAQGTMAEVEAKRKQTNEVRAKITAVEKQSGEFTQHQVELTDLIRELERLFETVSQNNSDLQGR